MPTTAIPSTAPADNGVAVEALLQAREALTAAPAAAAFTWKAASTWVHGSHTSTTFHGFFGLGAEQSHREPLTVETDHPELFAATDKAPTPPEMILGGLAGCLTAGIASVAQNRGITLDSVTATVEGDMDLQGILGIDADVRNGFDRIRVRYHIEADADRDELAAVIAQSQKRSAVYDILVNPTAVAVELA